MLHTIIEKLFCDDKSRLAELIYQEASLSLS